MTPTNAKKRNNSAKLRTNLLCSAFVCIKIEMRMIYRWEGKNNMIEHHVTVKMTLRTVLMHRETETESGK